MKMSMKPAMQHPRGMGGGKAKSMMLAAKPPAKGTLTPAAAARIRTKAQRILSQSSAGAAY